MRTAEQELQSFKEIDERYVNAGHRHIDLYVDQVSDMYDMALAENDGDSGRFALMRIAFKIGVSMGYRARKKEEKEKR